MDMSDAIEAAKSTVDTEFKSPAQDILKEISKAASDMGNESNVSGSRVKETKQKVDVMLKMDEKSSGIWDSVIEIVDAFESGRTFQKE